MIGAFLATGIGRKLAAGAAIALGVLIAIWRIFAAGKKAARVDGMKAQLKNVEIRHEVDDTVARADDARRDELRRKWTKPKAGL